MIFGEWYTPDDLERIPFEDGNEERIERHFDPDMDMEAFDRYLERQRERP